MLKIIKKGIIVIKVIILGRIRYLVELIFMIFNVLICWVICMVFILEVILEFIFFDRIKYMMEEENFSNMILWVV